jgi:hypothetical protein
MQTQLKPPSPEIAKEVVVRDPCAAQPQPKRTKFTPENVRQIINLVERGKSNDEIADIIGLTTGTLQVTCSKLGISLRRPRFNTGTGMLGRRRRGREIAASSVDANSQAAPCIYSGNVQEPPIVESPPMQNTQLLNGGWMSGTDRCASMILTMKMHYKGKEKTHELPLTPDMIGRIALEAEFRGLATAELVVRLIAAAIEKDMVDAILGQD